MELLLWLWLYDDRWFWNIKVSKEIYKVLWILPIFSNFILMLSCIFYLSIDSATICDKSFKIDILSRAFLSSILIFSIILFYINFKGLTEEEESGKDFLHKVYPVLKENHAKEKLCKYISRKCLLDTKGIVLLLLSIGSLFLSYMSLDLRNRGNERHKNNCDKGLEKFIIIHSYFTILSNAPIVITLVSTILIKSSCMIMSFMCPNFRIKLVKSSKEIVTKKIY